VEQVFKTEINGHGVLLRWPRNALYSQKLALTSPTSGSHSVSIAQLRTEATEFCFFYVYVETSNRPQKEFCNHYWKQKVMTYIHK
jgi:hypothetical protein